MSSTTLRAGCGPPVRPARLRDDCATPRRSITPTHLRRQAQLLAPALFCLRPSSGDTVGKVTWTAAAKASRARAPRRSCVRPKARVPGKHAGNGSTRGEASMANRLVTQGKLSEGTRREAGLSRERGRELGVLPRELRNSRCVPTRPPWQYCRSCTPPHRCLSMGSLPYVLLLPFFSQCGARSLKMPQWWLWCPRHPRSNQASRIVEWCVRVSLSCHTCLLHPRFRRRPHIIVDPRRCCSSHSCRAPNLSSWMRCTCPPRRSQ